MNGEQERKWWKILKRFGIGMAYRWNGIFRDAGGVTGSTLVGGGSMPKRFHSRIEMRSKGFNPRSRWAKAAGGRLLVLLLSPWIGFALQGTCVSANPQQAQTPFRAAQSALEHGNAPEAVRILANYLQAHPTDVRARLTLGQVYAGAGQNAQASEEFQTVLKAEPDNYVALAALGEIYERNGQLDKAEPLLSHAVKASHGIPQIRIEWAIVLVRLHEYKKAESTLAGLQPPAERDAEILFYRVKASVSSGLGKSGEAAAEMEKALALSPSDRSLLLATAQAQLQAKNWKRAVELVPPLFSETHEPAVGMMLLEAQLGANADFRATLDSIRTVAKNSTEELEIRQRLAELLIAYDRFQESINDLQRAAELSPANGDLLFNLTLAQFKAGRLDDALITAEKTKQLGDTADLEDLLGDIQEARGDNLAAVKSYQAAVSLAPNEEKYRLSLALELIRHKGFDAAKTVLEQAQSEHPNSWRICFALGMNEYFAGKEEESIGILLRAADLSPDPSIALRYVGDIQMDRTAGTDTAVVNRICKYADANPKDMKMQYYCGALLFKRDYAADDKSNMTDILRLLNTASAHLPKDGAAHCQLGKAYRWLEEWKAALRESETCVRLDPDSAQAHYRLGQIYQHEGQPEKAKQEMALYEAGSKRIADENARRDAELKTFLYTIEEHAPNR
jgi:tetratricopeptide (TPR) repeat protein